MARVTFDDNGFLKKIDVVLCLDDLDFVRCTVCNNYYCLFGNFLIDKGVLDNNNVG